MKCPKCKGEYLMRTADWICENILLHDDINLPSPDGDSCVDILRHGKIHGKIKLTCMDCEHEFYQKEKRK